MRATKRAINVVPIDDRHILMMPENSIKERAEVMSNLLKLVYDRSPVHWVRDEQVNALIDRFYEGRAHADFERARNCLLCIVHDVSVYMQHTHGWRFHQLIGTSSIVFENIDEYEEDEDGDE